MAERRSASINTKNTGAASQLHYYTCRNHHADYTKQYAYVHTQANDLGYSINSKNSDYFLHPKQIKTRTSLGSGSN